MITTPPSKSEASRLKFELAISGFDGNPDLTRTPKGYYADFSVQRAYLGWLAALLQAGPPAETFEEELGNMTALWSIAHAERSEALTQVSELTAAHEEETTALKEAMEGLMKWQVKNVSCWSNPAYDHCARVMDKYPSVSKKDQL